MHNEPKESRYRDFLDDLGDSAEELRHRQFLARARRRILADEDRQADAEQASAVIAGICFTLLIVILALGYVAVWFRS